MRSFIGRVRRPRNAGRGQSLVEFALVLIPFVFILMGIFDLGRAIYMLNGTAEAAREIARVTSVHAGCAPSPGVCDFGSSAEAADVIDTQRHLVPGLTINPSTDITCVDITDTLKADSACQSGTDYVKVYTRTSFTPITPLVSMFGSHTFESYSRVRYYP